MDLPKGLNVGEVAPDVSLLDPETKPVRLGDLRRDAPVVLVWYHLAFTGG
ncbi:MAG TPA: hypothetical protein VF282_03105 [Bacillota bacterium]